MTVPPDAGTAPLQTAAPPSEMSAGSPEHVSTARFRDAFSHFTTAVSIISTAGPAGMAGVTCSAIAALSDDPPLVGVCIHRKSGSNAAIRANRVLCVNALAAGQKDLSLLFSGVGGVPMPERFARGSWGILTTGSPHCLDAVMALDCEVVDVRDVGTHTLFVAQVVATAQADSIEPLIYFRRTFGSTYPL